MIIHLGPMAGTVVVVVMGVHTIRWRSGATGSGQSPCLPMLGLRQCALSPFPACCYRQSLLANADLQHGACRCAWSL